MASPPSSPENGDESEFAQQDSSEKPASSPHHKMSPRNRALFFLTAWLIVLMPFLFWWNTWFGRQLSGKQIGEFLNDEGMLNVTRMLLIVQEFADLLAGELAPKPGVPPEQERHEDDQPGGEEKQRAIPRGHLVMRRGGRLLRGVLLSKF